MTFERLTWLIEQGGDSRRSTGDHRYDSAVVPEIGSEDMMLPSECALVSEDVRTAIAAFDIRVGDTLAPLESLLVRIESSASSRIENVAAPVPDLLMAETGEDQGRSVAEVMGNFEATTAAIVLAEDISPETILDIHRALLGSTHPVLAGRWRNEAVWIGSYSGGPPEAEFVPPSVDRIPDAIEDLCNFMARTDMPVFIQAMVMHAHFETIHPFADGNGRVGRALVHALLRREGLTKAATLPISAGIVSQKHRYIEALTEYRMGDFVPIVELGADAVFAALRNASHLFDDVIQMQKNWRSHTESFRSDALVHPIIEILLHHPVVDTEVLEPMLDASPASIRRALNDLVAAGVIDPIPRSTPGSDRFVCHDIVHALNAFTERSINPFGRH
ncbi:Fic family protein [Ilumatobacter nonamiensis]|uniref:Fic family protein n=1 Tax=Ilumatobacter nonamiensis TaxID=467093 RepID=UPI0003488AB6|nr:Fic family protein [Ilumatobacter nonamiensis]